MELGDRVQEGESVRHLSLFSGIGGIDLAAHWAGFRTVAFVERDEFCQKVLAKNFPGVPIYDDVTTFRGSGFTNIDLVSGGFPCQDISRANRHAKGIEGERSGLWSEMARIIGECLPRMVLAENSPSLRDRGYDRVKRDLESLGYTVWPIVVEGGDVGAEQKRERVFVLACLDSLGSWEMLEPKVSNDLSRNSERQSEKSEPRWHYIVLRPDTEHCEIVREDGSVISAPVFCGSVDGVPNRLDRCRALGNAVDPRMAYPILKAIADEIRGAA